MRPQNLVQIANSIQVKDSTQTVTQPLGIKAQTTLTFCLETPFTSLRDKKKP